MITVPAGMGVPGELFEEDFEDEDWAGLAMISPTASGVKLPTAETVRIEPLVPAVPLSIVPMKGMPKTWETGT